MAKTAPSDLAVAFRSISRRLGEAAGDGQTAPTATVDQLVRRAAGLMRSSPRPDAIADAIEAVPADAWDLSVLNELRSIALELGGSIREIARAHGVDDEDD